ncbi:hypothetical protein [Actinomadura sp. 21ATH]|uniref:hypothetical protein n=1 Tax=Actinomadura sp. 21ATH TaxID=1735444 RepID=UPI0035BF420D
MTPRHRTRPMLREPSHPIASLRWELEQQYPQLRIIVEYDVPDHPGERLWISRRGALQRLRRRRCVIWSDDGAGSYWWWRRGRARAVIGDVDQAMAAVPKSLGLPPGASRRY